MSFISNVLSKIKANFADLGSADGLRGTVFRGGAWLGAGSLVEQVIRFARNMLLTRLLAPSAFGTMAIVLSATSLIGILAEVGAREALIQNPRGSEDEYVGATFWLSFGRAAMIYLTVFVTAPFISRFYGNAELSSLARIATLSVVFDGLMSPRAIVAMKQMKYAKWAIVQNGGGILGVLTTVVLSFFMRDVWALVLGYCSENAARCVLSYAICPFRPRFHVDTHAFKDLTSFSRRLFGLAFLNLVFTRVDIFVLGKLFPAADLGLYSMAVYLVQTPTVFLAAILLQTLLPALSRIQDDHERMNRILLKVSSATLLLGLPALVFVGFCGRSLLTLIYGPRYSGVAPALVLAAVASFINILNVQITLVFYAKGTPHLHRRSVAVMAVAALVLVYPLAKGLGIWAGQLACLIAVIAGYLLQLERVRTVTGLKLGEYGRRFLVPTAISLGIGGLWLMIGSVRSLSQPVVNISVGLVGCLLAYGCAAAVFLRSTMKVESGAATAASG